MRIGELAREAGVSVKALRYYESVGLLRAERLPNGYRDYGAVDVRLAREVHALSSLGIRVDRTRPFLDCLVAGNERADDCPDSIRAYRAAIAELDERVAVLNARRAALAALLEEATARPALCEFSAGDEMSESVAAAAAQS
ncbi:MerR family DNA-binding transcriptional regulator [Naasia aerilata]|uniref:HTH merR-type domain-containing protein n=1 Tax=Naasia aerilata TaxID=1162966 RepID=A0ABM8G8B0_9MICO|nr:MerR family DNA-binding transcriptional regulator [Naasia aerilata]BDZ44417.1 hypothetical protein GCM10025866_03260 [Naasia aerilata]